MTVDLRSEAPVASPCINICRMQPQSGLCEGCQRTIDEIVAWSQMSEEGKRAVWAAIGQRRAAAAGRSVLAGGEAQ